MKNEMKISFQKVKRKSERKNEMKNIGRYNGISCYECSHSEYVNAYENNLDDGKQIFIINGTMVQKNTIVGYYDGKHVNDVYDGKMYYAKMPNQKKKTAPITADNSKRDEKFVEEVKTSSSTGATYEEVVAKEIRFSDYSKIVDDFFAKLGV